MLSLASPRADVEPFRIILHVLPAILLAVQGPEPIELSVDLGKVSQNVIAVQETIPSAPGRRAFYFPKFIPGEHRASGPINGMVDLHFYADARKAQEIPWQRDPVDLFKLWADVPKGASKVYVSFKSLTEPSDATTPNLARIKWNRLLLYPEAKTTDAIPIRAAVVGDWPMASALQRDRPVSVTELIDSPAIVGRYAKSYDLGEIRGAKVAMDVMAEEDGYQILPDASLAKAKELVRQAGLLFGGRHFRQYRFLVTLSDAGAGAGLEHHESSEDGSGLKAASEDSFGWGELLAHEFAHSWNGKYRRPAGLATPDFHTPMDGEGLWVYEGLTQYLGYVLATRSGFVTPDEWRDNWASVARSYEIQGGRSWRPVVDTARSVGLVRGVSGVWAKERRGTDYYAESALVWLEADCLIRLSTKGQRSLDDFLRLFHGGTTDAPVVKPYTTVDVVKALNEVLPYDWAAFLRDRIDRVHPGTPEEALEHAGYRLKFSDAVSRGSRRPSYLAMLGMTVGKDGAVTELSPDGAAFVAGIGPGAKIKSLDGKPFDLDALTARVSKPGKGSLSLVIERTGKERTLDVAFEGGPYVPHLEPIPGRPDLLRDIARPLP